MNLSQCQELSLVVNEYFKRQYKDKPTKLRINNRTLYRPNHCLAHGMRQGFLSVRIVEYMIRYKHRIIDNRFYKWIDTLDNRDLVKIQFCGSFLRSGRQSEVSSKDNPKLHLKYQFNDVRNFKRHCNLYFNNNDEIEYYSKSMLWKSDTSLNKVFKTAHRLDLRRINKFSKSIIFNDIRKDLHGIFDNKQLNHFVSTMWNLSGVYLKVTGDRDMETGRPYHYRLIGLCYNPKKLAEVLHSIR